MAETASANNAVDAAPAPASVSEPPVGERCRCCMAPGPAAKDLSSQYDFMGEKEVYADMLLESFDIRLQKILSAGWTICEVCIGRLRDSSNFKKQVLYSERCLLQSVGQQPSSGDQKISGDSKMKMVKCESMSDDNDASFLDDDYFDLETDIKEVSVKFEPQASTSELSNDEDIPLSKMTTTKKKVTTRSSLPMLTISPLKRTSVQKTPAKKTITLKSGVKITSTSGKLTPGKLNLQSASLKKGMGAVSKMLATASKLGQSPGTKMVLKPGQTKLTLGSTTLKRATVPKAGTKVMVKPGAKLAAAAERGRRQISTTLCEVVVTADKTRDRFEKLNAIMLLQNSNIIPFKWNVQVYTCFYCNEPYDDVLTLKDHSSNDHTNKEKFENAILSVRDHKVDVYVKVDITSIDCKVCSKVFGNLEDLRKHLESVHGKKFHSGYSLGVSPFRFSVNEYRCGICHHRRNTFHRLNQHVTTHFKNYICEMCEEGFHSAYKLKDHLIEHYSGFLCVFCQKHFRNKHTLRQHVQYTHDSSRFKCTKCPKAYPVRTALMGHYFSAHKMMEVGFKCDSCDGTFSTRQRLLHHVRRDHLRERSHVCDVCKASFYLKKDLTDHVSILHEKDPKFECEHCSKKFAVQKYLTTHIRIHTNDKRCVCKECGAAFVQHASLNYHVRRHHANV